MEIELIQRFYGDCNTEQEIDSITGKRISEMYGDTLYDEIAWNTKATEALACLMVPHAFPSEKQKWAQDILTQCQSFVQHKDRIIAQGKLAKQQLRLSRNGV